MKLLSVSRGKKKKGWLGIGPGCQGGGGGVPVPGGIQEACGWGTQGHAWLVVGLRRSG